MLTRRLFIGGMSAAFAAGPRKLFAKEAADFDDNLLVFLSDVHAGAPPARAPSASRNSAEAFFPLWAAEVFDIVTANGGTLLLFRKG